MKTPICNLCNKVEVEMENGEPTSSFCNGCYFDVLVFRCHEMWIFEDDMIAFGYNYQTVPIQVLNPFDSQWEDCSGGDYAEEMKEEQKRFPHLEKYKDTRNYQNWEVVK